MSYLLLNIKQNTVYKTILTFNYEYIYNTIIIVTPAQKKNFQWLISILFDQ